MIVIYDEPRLLSLPYKNERGQNCYYEFKPGKNEISEDVWKSIAQEAGADMDYYSTILKVFKSKKVERVNEVELDIGAEKIDFKKLKAAETKELIDNTMDIDELKGYLKSEKKRKPKRKAVLKSIEAKIKEIEDFVEKIKKD